MKRFRVRAPVELLGGFVILLAGMCLLADRPVFGVLGMLGGMALLLRSMEKLFTAEVKTDS